MTRRRWRITVLAALATLAAVYPITTLFTSTDWLPKAILVIALTAASGLILRGISRHRLLITVVQLVVVLYATLALFVRESFTYGLPGPDTVEVVTRLGEQAYATIQKSAAPAPLNDAVSFYLVIAVGLVAVFVDAMAATWRAPAAAGLPLLTAYLITAANGSGTNASSITSFIAPVSLWLVMLHTTARAQFGKWSTTRSIFAGTAGGSSDDASALRALSGGAAKLGLWAVVIALVIPALTPHLDPKYLTDGLGRGAGSKDRGLVGFNDTIDLRNSLASTDQTPVLRYSTTGPTPSTLRVFATSNYSGGEWTDARPTGAGPDRPVPLPEPDARKDYVMTVSANSLRAPRLAVPYPVVSAPRISGTTVSVDPVTRALRVDRAPNSYAVTYADLKLSEEQLREAGRPTSADILRQDLEVPAEARSVVRQWSDEIVGSLTNDYDKAAAIQAHLRDVTRYTYSLDLPPAPLGTNGRAVDPITAFYETRTGYCTQFASAMIMLARAQGIPARLAVGFLAGSRDGSSYVVRQSDAHAWPELYFEGAGWVRFEPTISRGGPPPYSITGTDGPTGTVTTTQGGATATQSGPSRPRGFEEGENTGTAAQTPWWQRALTGSNLVLLLVVLVVVVGTFLMPLTAWVARTLRRRRAATRQDLVEIEWHALASHFEDLGLTAPPGATLRMASDRYINQGHLDEAHATAMRRVTATLERSRYDRPERTTPQETEQLHRDIRAIRRQVSATRAWTTRLRSFLWPAEGVSVWRQLGDRLRRR